MKYAHVRTEPVLPSGRGRRGGLYIGNSGMGGRGRGKYSLSPRRLASAYKLHVWVLLVEGLPVAGIGCRRGRGFAQHAGL